MNKRFITAVFTAVACAACALSFSACGNDGEVTDEAAWKAAFEANLNAESITIKGSQNYKQTVTYEENGNTVTDITYQTIDLSAYVNGGGMYADYKIDRHNSSGASEIFNEYTSYSLHELGEWENDLATSDYYNFKTTDNWETVKATSRVGYYQSASNYRGNRVFLCKSNSYDSCLLTYKYTTEPRPKGDVMNAEWISGLKSLADLYSAFTYNKGIYSAELYSDSFNDLITVKITVKNGVVAALLIEETSETKDGKYNYMLNGTFSYEYSDIGTTSYSLPPKLVEAIEAEKNNNL